MDIAVENVYEKLANGFTAMAGDCGGENINKNTVDARGLLDGGLFGELFVKGSSDARRPLGMFQPCGNHGVSNADHATALGSVHESATTAVKFMRQGVNQSTLKYVSVSCIYLYLYLYPTLFCISPHHAGPW